MWIRPSLPLALLIIQSSILSAQVFPALDCWEPWLAKGVTSLSSPAGAGATSVVLPVFFTEINATLTINPGAANQETVVTTGVSNVSTPVPFAPALQFNHLAGEPVQWSVTYMKSYWGYFNPNASSIAIPSGSSTNFMLPGTPSAGQPSSFLPGVHKYAFRTISRRSRDMIWVLENQVAISRAVPELGCRYPEFGLSRKTLSLARGQSYPGVVIADLPRAAALDPLTVFSVVNIASPEISFSNVRASGDRVLADIALSGAAPIGSHTMDVSASLSGKVIEQAGVFLEVFDTCPGFTISPNALPAGQIGMAYPSTQLTGSGATGPFSLTLESGVLPKGMTFTSGLLSGLPQEAGTFPLTIRATSLNSCLTSLSVPLTIGGPSCAAVVSPQLTLGGFRQNLATGRWMQTVTLRNTGVAPVAGPIAFVLDNLSANAALVNAAGTTTCAAPLGRPYVAVNAGTDNVLSPGEAAAATLEFTNATPGQSITYNPRVLAGGASR